MKLIDCHVHAFPDFLAEKAMEKLTKNCGYQPSTNGTLANTLKVEEKWGCKNFILLNIATSPNYVEKVNNFLIENNKDGVISFGSIHPQYHNYKEEIEKLYQNGIKGVKFHPEYQEFNMDDKAVYPIYEELAKRDMVMLFHSGFDPAYVGSHRCDVQRGAKVATDFNGAKLVFAHLGNLMGMDDTLKYLVGKDVYFDISMAIRYYKFAEIEKFIKSHDINKFLYATDCPWSDGAKTQDLVNSLNITNEDKEKVFYKNAEKLLNITI
ncbi:MAG: amidohydrolase family protein [Clostridiales bacterium]